MASPFMGDMLVEDVESKPLDELAQQAFSHPDSAPTDATASPTMQQRVTPSPALLAKRAKTQEKRKRTKERKPQRQAQHKEAVRAMRQAGCANRNLADVPDPVFRGSITVKDYDEARDFANLVCSSGSLPDDFTLWVDSAGYGSGKACGYAAVFRFAGQKWKYEVGRTRSAHNPDHAELMGIRLAIELATKHIEQLRSSEQSTVADLRVRVFSDSKPALNHIDNMPYFTHKAWNAFIPQYMDLLRLLNDIAQMAQNLQRLGASIELHWVPGGNVDGNRIANSAAKYARLSPHKGKEIVVALRTKVPQSNDQETIAEKTTHEPEQALPMSLRRSCWKSLRGLWCMGMCWRG